MVFRTTQRIAVVLAALGLLAFGGGAAAGADPVVAPYQPPGFGGTCDWHRFGEGEWPSIDLFFQHQVCVEYSKRDITFDNGGALRFLLAEPSRFALAIPACRYWQLDHWSVQRRQGDTPIVTWDGSYWFDKADGRAGIKLTNFRVQGVTAGIGDVAAAVQPYAPELADLLRAYGAGPGESGLSLDSPHSLACW